MSTNQLRITVALVAIVVSAAFLYVWFTPFGPSSDAGPHKALGTVMAEEALKLRGGSGKIIVLTRDTRTYKNPAADVQLESFRHEVKKGGSTIASDRWVRFAPIRLASVPPGDFQDLITRNTPDDVIVSFLGPPVLTDAQLAKVGHKPPKILALCSGWMPRQVDLRSIFQQQALDVAVISREHPMRSGGGKGAREQFDEWFAIVTPQNVSD